MHSSQEGMSFQRLCCVGNSVVTVKIFAHIEILFFVSTLKHRLPLSLLLLGKCARERLKWLQTVIVAILQSIRY